MNKKNSLLLLFCYISCQTNAMDTQLAKVSSQEYLNNNDFEIEETNLSEMLGRRYFNTQANNYPDPKIAFATVLATASGSPSYHPTSGTLIMFDPATRVSKYYGLKHRTKSCKQECTKEAALHCSTEIKKVS